MIVDAVRFVADRLAHATTGVNALLASVPRVVSDAQPADVTIYNEMDAAVTALGPIDEALVAAGPALLVALLDAPPLDGNPRHAAFGGEVAVRVVVRYGAPEQDGATFARDAWHTLRAAARACIAPSTASTAAATTTQHDVRLGPIEAVQFFPPPADAATRAFVPSLVVTVPARDRWALGAS